MTQDGITLENIIDKTVLLGICYFDVDDSLLEQRQFAGKVVRSTPEDGITLRTLDGSKEFDIPSDLRPWFIAPEGQYDDIETGEKLTNPDFLITWDVYKSQENATEGEHEWWEWRPRLVPPTVG
ncbi:MAG: hypothetical protein MI864_20915 [Pseudomonadales bacterium]|nr:hypothetical protein [Pseudomonadales bacterium]